MGKTVVTESPMPIEVEKKYRLNREQFDQVSERLAKSEAVRADSEFEVNTLYGSKSIDLQGAVIRLRRTDKRSILTYKKRLFSPTAVKHQLEEETQVTNPDATEAILRGIGLSPSLIYEKRRQTWQLSNTEIAMDELPFGLFMEIEGEEHEIKLVEAKLDLTSLESEEATYPELTKRLGKDLNGVIEARFTDLS